MTLGVGGSDAATELAKLSDQTADICLIQPAEFEQRIVRARQLMNEENLQAIYLNAGTNLFYFTGTHWHPSERMVGALLCSDGQLHYIAPHFERGTLEQFTLIEGDIHTWQEHESPYQLLHSMLQNLRLENARIGIDEATPFFISNGLASACTGATFVSATAVTAGCRGCKSQAELALMQKAKDITLQVHRSVAKILRPGISTAEVSAFIDAAHRKLGAPKGSYFCIVLFGVDSSFPHGVRDPKPLNEGDMVLIDTGCSIGDYISDITRSYVFGEPTAQQRAWWQVEKDAQSAAFEAAVLGEPCAAVDTAARRALGDAGMGPDYQTPGCPHRTGHGIGLDIHEWPYLVRSEQTPLKVGMCFSNEPMLVIPGECGIRLEDHFYMTQSGPRWFTEPSESIDNPLNL